MICDQDWLRLKKERLLVVRERVPELGGLSTSLLHRDTGPVLQRAEHALDHPLLGRLDVLPGDPLTVSLAVPGIRPGTEDELAVQAEEEILPCRTEVDPDLPLQGPEPRVIDRLPSLPRGAGETCIVHAAAHLADVLDIRDVVHHSVRVRIPSHERLNHRNEPVHFSLSNVPCSHVRALLERFCYREEQGLWNVINVPSPYSILILGLNRGKVNYWNDHFN